MNDESPLSQSEVCWQTIERDDSPKRVGIRARSSNLLVQTPVRVVKRHVSSPAIGTIKIKNRFGDLKTTAEEEVVLKKDVNFDSSDDDLFDFSDDQMLAVLKKVDEEEQLKKQKDEKGDKISAIANEINFEDSFDDAILASIPLEELSKCSKSKTSSVEIVFNAGMSQIVNKSSPARALTKNKSMETVNHIGTKRTLERHNSLPQQPLSTSKNRKNKIYSRRDTSVIIIFLFY